MSRAEPQWTGMTRGPSGAAARLLLAFITVSVLALTAHLRTTAGVANAMDRPDVAASLGLPAVLPSGFRLMVPAATGLAASDHGTFCPTALRVEDRHRGVFATVPIDAGMCERAWQRDHPRAER